MIARLRRGAPIAIAAVALGLVVIGLAMAFIGGEGGGGEEESPGSIANREAEGTYGWAGVLEKSGYDVRAVRRPFADGGLPDAGTVVLAAVEDVDADEVEALSRWIDAAPGRRLVLVGVQEELLEVLFGGSVLGYRGADGSEPVPVVAAPETVGITALGTPAHTAFTPNPMRTLYAAGASPFVVSTARASGNEILVVAELDPLANADLRSGANAAFGVRLAGTSATVSFDEFHHGEERTPGLFGLLPENLQSFLLQILLVLAVAAVAVGVRFGPPLAVPEQAPRRRVEFVRAMGRAYGSTGATPQAVDLIRVDLRDRLRARLLLGHDAGDDILVARAHTAGLDPAEVASVLRDDGDASLSFTDLAQRAAALRRVLEGGERELEAAGEGRGGTA